MVFTISEGKRVDGCIVFIGSIKVDVTSLMIKNQKRRSFNAGASAIPLLRGVEGCVHQHAG